MLSLGFRKSSGIKKGERKEKKGAGGKKDRGGRTRHSCHTDSSAPEKKRGKRKGGRGGAGKVFRKKKEGRGERGTGFIPCFPSLAPSGDQEEKKKREVASVTF